MGLWLVVIVSLTTLSALALFAVAAAGSQPVVISRDPLPPGEWEQAVTFRCGDQSLLLSGFGAARPLERAVEITVNGGPVAGEGVEQFRRDLSNRRAVYRIAGQCPQADGQISMIVSVGEKLREGSVVYRSGSATFLNGRLVEYTGLVPASPDSFWYR